MAWFSLTSLVVILWVKLVLIDIHPAVAVGTNLVYNAVMEKLEQIRTWIQQKQWPEARAALIERVRHTPQDAEAWARLATVMTQMEFGATAGRCLARSALLQPIAGGQLLDLPAADLAWPDRSDNDVEQCLLVPPKTVGAAMIVKDASRTIAKALTALIPAVDQFVIVDTGSTDDTVAIIRSLGIEPLTYEWNDDFAAARNFALSHVNTDWVLSIDSDEVLWAEDAETVRTVAGLFDSAKGAFALKIIQMNQISDMISPSLETRMFPNRRGIRWYRPIHEQLVHNARTKLPAYPVRIRVLHDGYDARQTATEQKYWRNVKILTQHVKQEPNDAVSHSFLGREYLMLNQPDQAIRHLTLAKELLAADASTAVNAKMDVERNLILAYEKKGDLRLALRMAEQMTEIYPQSVDAWYLRGFYHLSNAVTSLQQAIPALQRTIQLSTQGQHSADPTIGQFKAMLHLADVTRLSGNFAEARRLYNQVLNVIPNFSEVHAIIAKMDEQTRLIPPQT